jgi:hypothetical protein
VKTTPNMKFIACDSLEIPVGKRPVAVTSNKLGTNVDLVKHTSNITGASFSRISADSRFLVQHGSDQQLARVGDNGNPAKTISSRRELKNTPKKMHSWLLRRQQRGNLVNQQNSVGLPQEHSKGNGFSPQHGQLSVSTVSHNQRQVRQPSITMENLYQRHRIQLPDPDTDTRFVRGRPVPFPQDLDTGIEGGVCGDIVQVRSSNMSFSESWLGVHQNSSLLESRTSSGQHFSSLRSWAVGM